MTFRCFHETAHWREVMSLQMLVLNCGNFIDYVVEIYDSKICYFKYLTNKTLPQ